MKYLICLVLLGAVTIASHAETKKKTVYRKTQEVNFDDQDIDGVVHSPDGAYLVQKRGVKFTPLYKVQQHMEDGVLSSVDYLK